jgi:hypothetical protein
MPVPLLKLGADLLDLVPSERLLPDRLAALGAMNAGAGHASLDAAAGDRSLAEHLEHRASRRRGCVKRLLMRSGIKKKSSGV